MKRGISLAVATAAVALLACSDAGDPAAAAPDRGPPTAGSLSVDHCVNFAFETVGSLGVYVSPTTGDYVFGGLPTPATIAGLDGVIYSFVGEDRVSGLPVDPQGAQHIVLHHHFTADQGSWFQTDDRAPCAPGNGEGCIVDDQMRIVAGEGVFDHADGVVRNHGIVNIPAGWLDLNLAGRVCGDGIEG